MTHWKSIRKIDAHIHILPDAVIAANQGSDDPFVAAGGVDDYMRIMDKYGIEKAVIMPFNDPFLMSMEFNISAVHENMRSFKRRYPDRFLLFADIDTRSSADDTLAELERVMSSGDFAGIKIHSVNTELPLDGEYYDAVFTFAEKNRIPVEIHCYPKDEDPEDFCAPGRLRWVLERHPALRVCAAHLGGFQYEALLGLKVYVNISAILPDMVQRFGIAETESILRAFGTDKLIFASDYPDSRSLSFGDIYPRYFEILEAIGFSEDEIRAVCHENVLRFLGAESRKI